MGEKGPLHRGFTLEPYPRLIVARFGSYRGKIYVSVGDQLGSGGSDYGMAFLWTEAIPASPGGNGLTVKLFEGS